MTNALEKMASLLGRRAAAPLPTIHNSFGFDEFAALFCIPTWSGANVTVETAARAIPVQACCAQPMTILIGGYSTNRPMEK